jgi:hypothetical protein
VFVKDLCSVILVIVEPGSIRGGVWKNNGSSDGYELKAKKLLRQVWFAG